ncbi:MAG TPA: DUF2807 domain-containing protein [Gammaproteobacteria bacterium]|nr:DUF2807 domain-containing protein [Gammaproteobacteria bacterium]
MRARIRLIVSSALVLTSPAAFAQAVDKTTDLKPFETLVIGGCFESRLAPGTPERVVVNATAAQHERIRVVQDGKTVKIGFPEERGSDDYNICREGKIRVSVTANFAKDRPVELRLAGSGSLDADVPRAAKLTTTIAGSGNTDARALDCGASAKVAVHGSGGTKLNGKTKACEFRINGSGDVGADEFACESADVQINGSGSVALAKIGQLKVAVNGSGNVKYRGDPTLLGVDIHGSGRVQKL